MEQCPAESDFNSLAQQVRDLTEVLIGVAPKHENGIRGDLRQLQRDFALFVAEAAKSRARTKRAVNVFLFLTVAILGHETLPGIIKLAKTMGVIP